MTNIEAKNSVVPATSTDGTYLGDLVAWDLDDNVNGRAGFSTARAVVKAAFAAAGFPDVITDMDPGDALAAYKDIAYVAQDMKMSVSTSVLKTLESTANAVAKLLKENGATRRGRKQIAKATGELKAKYVELSAAVTAHYALG